MNDTNSTVARVKDVLGRAGTNAWLVAYDINAIQQLVTASNRPIAMRGASRTIQNFDHEQRARELAIFAGGGRGYELARSQDEAIDRIAQLQRDFRGRTMSGVLAADAVPYDRNRPKASLTWLRRKLENAKDAAPRPGGDLPTNKDELCEDCHALRQAHQIGSREAVRHVCTRCAQFIEHAREDSRNGDISESLLAYAQNRRIAAISADGNNMGVLFGMLESLDEMAVVSEYVGQIFQSAHERAAGKQKILAPVTGGDDIRAFMAPELVLDYVGALARGIEDGVRSAGNLGGILSRPNLIKAFGRIGIGIGAVVAGDHYPASQLIVHAHALERRAKRICRHENGPRSAFDFAILLSEHPSFEDRRVAPLSMEPQQWQQVVNGAKWLREVPSTQRAILADRFTFSSEEEFNNLFLYQVARSDEWRTWFERCKIPWKNRDAVRAHVAAMRADLVDLLPAAKDANR